MQFQTELDIVIERVEKIENRLKDFDRYIQVLNDHSLYLSECVEKLKTAFDLIHKTLFVTEESDVN